MAKSIRDGKKLSEVEIDDLILTYLNEQMRPYNINDLLNNLHNVVPKSKCLQSLNKLTLEGRIHLKQFGKITIWVCNDPFAASVVTGTNKYSDDGGSSTTSSGSSSSGKNTHFYISKLGDLKSKIKETQTEIDKLTQLKFELIDYCQEYDDYIFDKEELVSKISQMETEILVKSQKLKDLELKKNKQDTEINNNKNGKLSMEALQKNVKVSTITLKRLKKSYCDLLSLLKSVLVSSSMSDRDGKGDLNDNNTSNKNGNFDIFLYEELGLEKCVL